MLNKLPGEMLQQNLLRSGVDLQIDNDLLYLDVNNRTVGIGTTFADRTLTVNGTLKAGAIAIDGAEVRAVNGGAMTLATDPDQPVIVTSGSPNSLTFFGPGNELASSDALMFDGNALTVNRPAVIQGTVIDTGSITSTGPLSITTSSGNLSLSAGAGGTVNIAGIALSDFLPNKVMVTDPTGLMVVDDGIGYDTDTNTLTVNGTAIVGNVRIETDNITSVSTTPLRIAAPDILIESLGGGVKINGANPTSIFYAGANSEILTHGSLTWSGTALAVDQTQISNGLITTANNTNLVLSSSALLQTDKPLISTVGANSALFLVDNEWSLGGLWRDDTSTSLRISAGDTIDINGKNIAADIGHFIMPNYDWNQDLTVYTDGTVVVKADIVSPAAHVGNIAVEGNTISATDANGNVVISANGAGTAVFTGSNGIVLPVGDSSTRPTSPTVGVTRFNQERLLVETWDGTRWAEVGPNYVNPLSLTFTGDGSTVQYPLPFGSTSNGIIVSINGVVQVPGAAYLVGGANSDQLILDEPPVPGDVVEVRVINGSTTLTVALENPIVDGGFF